MGKGCLCKLSRCRSRPAPPTSGLMKESICMRWANTCDTKRDCQAGLPGCDREYGMIMNHDLTIKVDQSSVPCPASPRHWPLAGKRSGRALT